MPSEVVARATAAGFTVGPVVMRYSEASDTDAEWVYGDGYLWIYDSSTTDGSELIAVSQSTGAVVQTVKMPWVDRPLLPADDDGQGHANLVTVGGSTYLYTLPRAAGDMQGVGLLVHQFNPTASSPLARSAVAQAAKAPTPGRTTPLAPAASLGEVTRRASAPTARSAFSAERRLPIP